MELSGVPIAPTTTYVVTVHATFHVLAANREGAHIYMEEQLAEAEDYTILSIETDQG